MGLAVDDATAHSHFAPSIPAAGKVCVFDVSSGASFYGTASRVGPARVGRLVWGVADGLGEISPALTDTFLPLSILRFSSASPPAPAAGPGGGYSVFAGKDASRALATMKLDETSTDISGLTDEQKTTLDGEINERSLPSSFPRHALCWRLVPRRSRLFRCLPPPFPSPLLPSPSPQAGRRST